MEHQITVEDLKGTVEHLLASSYGGGSGKKLVLTFEIGTGKTEYTVKGKDETRNFAFIEHAVEFYNTLA
jgi:hypothetical protein